MRKVRIFLLSLFLILPALMPVSQAEAAVLSENGSFDIKANYQDVYENALSAAVNVDDSIILSDGSVLAVSGNAALPSDYCLLITLVTSKQEPEAYEYVTKKFNKIQGTPYIVAFDIYDKDYKKVTLAEDMKVTLTVHSGYKDASLYKIKDDTVLMQQERVNGQKEIHEAVNSGQFLVLMDRSTTANKPITSTGTGGNKTISAKTGDAQNVVFWIGALLLSAAVLAGMSMRKPWKRNKNNNF